MVASARVANMARRGPDFGVLTGEVSIDFARVMERQNTMRHGTSHGMEQWLHGMDNVDVYPAFATFVDAHTVQVGDQQISAETIVINAGARSNKPAIAGLDDVAWLDNARLLDLKALPQHLMIVGGSYIALEFAQIFRRLGSQVTILQRGSQLMPREGRRHRGPGPGGSWRAKGSPSTSTPASSGRRSRGRSRSTCPSEQDGAARQVQGSHLLLAVGRTPNSDRLNLAAAGVEVVPARLHSGQRGDADHGVPHLRRGRYQRRGRVHPHRSQRR
ncbi:MAG: FAD-dependent oxidoreductase [Anaerolineae bacterium]